MALRLDSPMPPMRPVARWVNSAPLETGELRGRPTLIHFWALSCTACKEQLPSLERWVTEYGDRIHVVSIHTPIAPKDLDEETVVRAVHELGLVHPVALDGEDGALADRYHLHFTPSYFVFDANLRLRQFHAGVEAEDPVHRALERLLTGRSQELPSPQP